MTPPRKIIFQTYYLKFEQYDMTHKVEANKIGEGSYGVVYKIPRSYRGEDSMVAMKFLTHALDDFLKQKDFFREIEILARLNHPTLLKLIGFSLPMASNPDVILATPYMKNGNLRSALDKFYSNQEQYGFTRVKKSCCALGIAVGMMIIHKENMIHRDLKTENILLDDNFYPIIADFGISRILSISDGDNINMTMNRGTALYMSPELIKGEQYTQKVDVYAYAMILYEICTGKIPFQDILNIGTYNIQNKVIDNIRPTIPDDVPENYQNLIKICWDPDPNVRPSFEEIVNQVTNTDLLVFNDDDLDEYQAYEAKILERI